MTEGKAVSKGSICLKVNGMKVLVVGLGSMGKRRIRCLKQLGIQAISGFDPRSDRVHETVSTYGIESVAKVDRAMISRFDALVISVPPDAHGPYMQMCVDERKHFFVEASVIDEGLDELDAAAQRSGIVAAPSATLMFHPAPKRITELVREGRLGRVTNFIYHMGQWLPDWHSYEKVSEFYVSNPVTGGAREIVPFELTWLVKCFGWPERVFARVEKTTTIEGAEKIDDTYALSLRFAGHPATLVVDVVSRQATRLLTVVGDRGHLNWDWNKGCIDIFDGPAARQDTERYDAGTAAAGYNANIGEMMYVDEVAEFLSACKGQRTFRNTLKEDARVLRILTQAEESARLGKDLCLEKP